MPPALAEHLRLSSGPLHIFSQNSGPGRRWILYLQGCHQPCTTECLNRDLLDSQGGRVLSVEELKLEVMMMMAGLHGEVEGITVLGGEPTDQARPLHALLEAVREAGLSVMLYTGRTREWLSQPEHSAEARLLTVSDLLVAGPYLPKLADPALVWRGSSNQVVERLTERYTDTDLKIAMEQRGISLTLEAGDWSLTGFQSPLPVSRLVRRDREGG